MNKRNNWKYPLLSLEHQNWANAHTWHFILLSIKDHNANILEYVSCFASDITLCLISLSQPYKSATGSLWICLAFISGSTISGLQALVSIAAAWKNAETAWTSMSQQSASAKYLFFLLIASPKFYTSPSLPHWSVWLRGSVIWERCTW